MTFRVLVMNDVKEFDTVGEFATYIRKRALNARASERATGSIADAHYWNGMAVAYDNVAAMLETVEPLENCNA